MLKDKIRKARRSKGMKQTELADALNVHPNTVSNWERGVHVPQDLELESIARELGVAVSDLVSSEERTRTVSSRADQAAWIAQVYRDVADRDVAFVLGAIGAFVDPAMWLALVSVDSLAADTAITEELLARVWPDVLASPHLQRVGQAKYAFSLVLREM